MNTGHKALPCADEVENSHEELLDRVFFALSDPVRRAVWIRNIDSRLTRRAPR